MPPKGRKVSKTTSTKRRAKPKLSTKPKSSRGTSKPSFLKSDRQLEIILESIPIGTWEWSVNTNKIKWGGKIFEIFQIPGESFGSSNEMYLQTVHPEDRIKITNQIELAIARDNEYYLEHRIIRPDGEIRWLEAAGKVARNKNGRALKIYGTITDVTNRKRIEREREDWKARHELVSTSAGLVIYDYDLHSGTIIWSGNSDDVIGYKPAELGDIHRWAELVHPDDRAEASAQLEKAQAQTKAYDVHYRFRKKNGEYIFMHDRGFFLAGLEGKAERMLGMMNDVSQRFQAEESLRESESRFRILQEASFGGIGLHDKGRIIDCNQGLCDITGYTYKELIGKNGLELIAPAWRDFVYEKIITGYDKTYDVEGLRKDGSTYSLEIRGKNIPNKGQTIRVTEFRDITERKISEEQTAGQNKKLFAVAEELRRKNHQLQEFTQIVSHNLRSPVGNILTLLTFYENAASEEEKREYIALLKDSGAKTLMMLNELNEVLKIKQDKHIAKQDIYFEKMLQQVKSMLTSRFAEVKAHIHSNFEKAPVIHYPAIYLESILLNLLDNALKYHSPDRDCNIMFKTTYNDEGQLVLSVQDNGVGINLERYGHQVFKLRKTFHHHPESRGIGLFMIKNQIEAMGGQITVESAENEGTTFYVNFGKTDKDGR